MAIDDKELFLRIKKFLSDKKNNPYMAEDAMMGNLNFYVKSDDAPFPWHSVELIETSDHESYDEEVEVHSIYKFNDQIYMKFYGSRSSYSSTHCISITHVFPKQITKTIFEPE